MTLSKEEKEQLITCLRKVLFTKSFTRFSKEGQEEEEKIYKSIITKLGGDVRFD